MTVCEAGESPNYAFERTVMRQCTRAASALGYRALKPRVMRQRAAVQRGR